MSLSKPNLVDMKSEFPNLNFKLIEEKIIMKDDFGLFKDELDVSSDFLLSKPKVTSSESRGMETGWSSDYVDTSEIELDFIELEEILEKVCPGITMLQFKRLKREFVTEVDYSDGDCYTQESGFQFKIEYKKLYEFIKDIS